MLFPVLYVGSRLVMRCRPKRAAEMDFYTGIDEILADSYDEPPATTWYGKFWAWLM
jgi:yeast amino acid transporter